MTDEFQVAALGQRFRNLLELQLEPLFTQLHRWTGGAMPYPAGQIHSLWSHPRPEKAEDLLRQALGGLVQRIDRSGMDSDSYFLTVVNTLPYDRAEMVEADVQPLGEGLASFGLLDERGNPVELDLLQQGRVRFRAVVPSGGYRTYHLCRSGAPGDLDTIMRPAPQGWVMQNEFMRVVVGADGQVDLLDSETGIESPDVFGFENGSSAPLGSMAKPVVSIVENKGVLLEYGFGVALKLSLDAGSRHLSVGISFDGQPGKDGLRLLVHTDVHSDECIRSQPFGCVRRSNALEEGGGVASSTGLVSVKDWNKQMSIFSAGLCEYEHFRDERGTIGLTLASASGGQASYRLAVRPGQAEQATLLREMQCFQVPMLAAFEAVDRRCSNDEPVPQDVAYRLPTAEEQVLPPTQSGMAVDDAMVFSALKQAHDGAGWIMRFFNPSDVPVKVTRPEVGAKVSDLDERPGEAPWMAGAMVGAGKVITLRF